MKILAFIAALLLAATSVAAEASHGCETALHDAITAGYAGGEPASSGPDCHDAGGMITGSQSNGCDLAAFCAMLCGIAPPAATRVVLHADFFAIDFAAAVDHPRTIQQKPEAPPPRTIIL